MRHTGNSWYKFANHYTVNRTKISPSRLILFIVYPISANEFLIFLCPWDKDSINYNIIHRYAAFK